MLKFNDFDCSINHNDHPINTIKKISEHLNISVLDEKFSREMDKLFFTFKDKFCIPLKKDLPKSIQETL